jgi:serine phosphatase RsbU (regulator of sigma subunit)
MKCPRDWTPAQYIHPINEAFERQLIEEAKTPEERTLHESFYRERIAYRETPEAIETIKHQDRWLRLYNERMERERQLAEENQRRQKELEEQERALAREQWRRQHRPTTLERVEDALCGIFKVAAYTVGVVIGAGCGGMLGSLPGMIWGGIMGGAFVGAIFDPDN